MAKGSTSKRMMKYDPRCQETGLRSFRPGPTQTGLYSHRRWLEAGFFCIYEVEGLCKLCSENKGAGPLRGYREADMRLFFAYTKIRFSHDEAHIILLVVR